jgi:hypothetical protein
MKTPGPTEVAVAGSEQHHQPAPGHRANSRGEREEHDGDCRHALDIFAQQTSLHLPLRACH